MSEQIKKILIFVSIFICVILLFYIIRYIIRILTKYDPKLTKTISNRKNIKNFHKHIGKVTLDSKDISDSYFDKYKVKSKFGDYKNMHLYSNPFDNRSFAINEDGDFYRNLSNTFTKVKEL